MADWVVSNPYDGNKTKSPEMRWFSHGAGQGVATKAAIASLPSERVILSPGLDVAHGVYDDGFVGIEGCAAHARSVAFIDDELWLVIDRIATDRPRTVQALWHFHPDCSVLVDGPLAGSGQLCRVIGPIARTPTRNAGA